MSTRIFLPSEKRPLGLGSATTLVAASMIGVGVYTTSGYTLSALGKPWLVIAAWIVGGIIAICGAIGYASLATLFTESGGEYLFLSRTLHPVAGLMAGWVSLLAGFTGAIAIAAIGLEKYALPFLGESALAFPAGSVAIATIFGSAFLHTVGVRFAARAQDAVVILKLLMIGGFILFALATVGNWPVWTRGAAATITPTAVHFLDFANQLVWISFSYAGFNAAVYVAGEVTNPERNVPRAMIAGTLLVTIIYVILNAIFVSAAPVAVITGDQIEQVAATAAEAIGGPRFLLLVRIVIVTSLFTSISALIMTGPRVYAKMADDEFFPRWFCFRDQPPVMAIWLQATLAVIAVQISTLQELLGYLGLTLSLCSALTVGMLFVLRRSRPELRLPLGGVPAAIYVVATILLAVLYAIRQPSQAIAAVTTVTVGALLYPWIRKPKSPGPRGGEVDPRGGS